MKLPNGQWATVPERKVTHYLLNPAHPAGGSKAWFFLKHGFKSVEWRTLVEALLRIAREEEVVQTEMTPHSRRYVVDGRMIAPDGKGLNVRTAWYIDVADGAPRL